MDACEIVTLAEPGLLKVTVCEVLLPTLTLPKATGVGDAASCGTPCPVPLSVTVTGEVALLFTRLTLPVTDPTAVGANLTLNVLVCPGVSVSGMVIPVMEKPVPEAVAWLIDTLAVP